jgi:sugar O-acyltransferase (sialic acid O-acetyltransferase NeuD family)
MGLKCAIYGSGSLGRDVYEVAVRRNEVSLLWDDIVFVNDFEEEQILVKPYRFKFESILKDKDNFECVIAVGEPSDREILYDKVIDSGIKLTSIIDPTAIISPKSTIGQGTIICEFSSIHPGAILGVNCVIQPFCCIAHDIHIGKHSFFASFFTTGGKSQFGDKTFCGLHSSVKENLTIGDNAIIAMGATVIHDVAPNAVVIGNPAKVISGHGSGRVFK